MKPNPKKELTVDQQTKLFAKLIKYKALTPIEYKQIQLKYRNIKHFSERVKNLHGSVNEILQRADKRFEEKKHLQNFKEKNKKN